MKSLLILGLAVGLLILVLIGCGGTTEVVKTVTVERPASQDRTSAPLRLKPKRHAQTSAAQQTAPALVHCDPNIQVKARTTTCGFAQNVFWHYWVSGESRALHVWSPAAQSTFATTCQRDGEHVICTTSDDALIRFPQAAVDVYSEGQAKVYAESHDLGPDPSDSLPLSAPPPDSAPSPETDTRTPGQGSCDPNYSGECLDPHAVDYDCAAGSGNGPEYAGRVEVVGDDPYGLDADGDGSGCE
jgi:hypothetical protein